MLFISMFMAFSIFPAAATPSLPLPTLEAIPNVITIPEAGTIVSIEIWAKSVVEDWEIIAFQFSVPFQKEWLAPWLRVKGTFMEAFVNGGEQGTFYVVVSDIPINPKWSLTTVAVMILPDSTGAYHSPFPSGEGRLITLRYEALEAGEGQSMPVEITDIMILDQNLNDLSQFNSGLIADIDLDPDTLNLKSLGQWVTAYIELPEGDVNDIDVSSIKLNGTIPVDPEAPYAIGDYDSDGVPDLMVKFSRAAVSEFILSNGIKFGNVTLRLFGYDIKGHAILGSDTIRVKMPGDNNNDGQVDMCDIGIAARAFGSSLGNPRWNSVADENEDNKINMLDIVVTIRNFGKTY